MQNALACHKLAGITAAAPAAVALTTATFAIVEHHLARAKYSGRHIANSFACQIWLGFALKLRALNK